MDYKIVASVANPGSALGEAIGSSMEDALKKLLNEIADKYGCHYLTSGVRKTKSGKRPKKLLMSDKSGNEYDIDGVLANQSMKPLIIFESKYIRYKLDDTVEREVDKVFVELISNLGEVKVYEFESISDALDFLQDDGLKDLFLTTDSDSLFDPPPDLFEEL